MTGLRQFFIDPLPNTTANVIWFICQVLPLIAPIPGVLRGALRSMFLLCLFSTLYFVHGVMVAFEGDLLLFGAFEILFALALCAVTAWYVRQLRELQAHQSQSDD